MPQDKYSVFDEIIEGVQIVDSDWRYVYVNNTVALHGKYSKQELLGYTMMEKYPGIETTEMFASLKQCMTDRKHVQMINEFNFPDGSTGYFELRMDPVTDGVLILSFDVTKQKQAEYFLQHSNALLEEKVKVRTAELTAKNRELEQFAYIASHDLQEPIRTVANYIGVLKEDYSDQLDEIALKYLDVMNRANHRMSQLTSALLDYSRLGRDREIKTVDFSKLVKEVIDDLSQVITSSAAKITVEQLPTINAYEVEMRQVFQNLLTNALKFKKKKSAIAINISCKEKEEAWQFSIQDNGIGIDKIHFDRIFEIFQRLHQRDQYEGNGIGLANCKKIIELHRGHMTVESVVGEGSTFSFTIAKNIK
ncbi:MAG: sensor histidine kinase [Cytophagaceae bacterium]|jgi:PAS domain S-box-containing protein|nr:sensor histidine kinase [Cytophagaceae bacterium]